MTNAEILAEMKPEILALPDNEIKLPGIPLFSSIYEAECQAICATKDSEALAVVNCTPERTERLNKLVICARFASATHDEIDSNIYELRKQWKEIDYPEALKLRRTLLAACDLAFNGFESLEMKVAEIREGDDILDTIEDLMKLSVLGPENSEKLDQFNLPIEPFLKAGELAAELSRKRGVIDGDTYLDSEMKVLRDKAITLMQREVDFIRRCGKFVFREKPDKVKHYASAYKREKNKKQKKSSDSDLD